MTAETPILETPTGKPRARALGIPFAGIAGANNALTDVPGVEVGYATLIEGDDVRTGVTATSTRAVDRTPATRVPPASIPRTATAR